MRASSSTAIGHATVAPANVGKWRKVRSRVLAVPTWLLGSRRGRAVVLLVGAAVAAITWSAPHVRAWRHLRAARVEVERCHTSQAIRHLRLCRDTWPRDPEVMLLAARAARRAGAYADSERLLATYQLERGRDEAFTLERLLLDAESNQDQVVERCWKYVEEGRSDAPLLLEALTRGYLRRYRLGLARRCLDRWQQVQPDSPQMFYLEGLFHLDYAHAVSAAVSSYGRAVELDADHEEARLGLAVALLTSREFAKAADHFERLLQSQPDNVRVRVGLAECRDGLGETAEAAQLVEDALARQPTLAAALSLRGRIAFKNDQFAEAENWLRQASQRNPMDHATCYTLVLCLEKMNQTEAAQDQRRQLQQMERDSARFNEVVTKEIAQRPTDPALHCELALMLLRAGQRDEGARWIQSALQLDPNYAPARKAVADHFPQK